MMNRSQLFRWEFSILGIWLPVVKASTPVSLTDLATYDGTDYFMAYNDANDRFNPPSWITAVYHISFPQGDHVFIQYWCFHATSYIPDAFVVLPDPWNIWWHEGDWEMSQFVVKLDTSGSTIDEKLKPCSATASQHYTAQTLKWEPTPDTGVPSDYVNNQDYLERSGMRPLIYVAHLAHAQYFKASQFRISGTPSDNSGHQYKDGGVSWLGLRDIAGAASMIDTAGADLIYLEKDPIINRWTGYWGAKVQPGTIIPPHGDGTPGPKLRGPGAGGTGGLIQANPKAFHNNFLKVTQGSLAIP